MMPMDGYLTNWLILMGTLLKAKLKKKEAFHYLWNYFFQSGGWRDLQLAGTDEYMASVLF